MKKEVISYSGFSMMPPESVELLENNKGNIITLSSDAKIVDIQDYKILSFWDKIEEIGVWKWHKKYPYSKLKYEQLLDGYNWELKLRDRNQVAKTQKSTHFSTARAFMSANKTKTIQTDFSFKHTPLMLK